MSPAARRPDQIIASSLAAFARRGRIGCVHFAENAATTPPPLAYFVPFPRLYIALAGEDAMTIEREGQARLIRLRRGDAVVVPANCWNRPASNRASVALNVLFGRKQVGLSLVTHRRSRDGTVAPLAAKTVLHGAFDGAPRKIVEALLAVRLSGEKSAPPLVDALVQTLVEALTAPAPAPRRRAANMYESICMYVQEHFQTPLSRESVAAHFHVTPNHVSRLFKREGLVTFNNYVTYVRINWAKYLLKRHRQTIDEVATMCGFSATSYFCRIFKRKTGGTPSTYRQLPP